MFLFGSCGDWSSDIRTLADELQAQECSAAKARRVRNVLRGQEERHQRKERPWDCFAFWRA
jgi:hypothetical protein